MFCLTEDLCCFVGLVRTGWVFHKHTRRLFSGILNRRLLHPSLPGRQRRSCLPRPLKQTKTNRAWLKEDRSLYRVSTRRAHASSRRSPCWITVSPAMLLTENMASKMSLEVRRGRSQVSCWERPCSRDQVTTGRRALPPLVVVQVGKQDVLLHGLGQGRHALVVFWDDLGWKGLSQKWVGKKKKQKKKGGRCPGCVLWETLTKKRKATQFDVIVKVSKWISLNSFSSQSWTWSWNTAYVGAIFHWFIYSFDLFF